MSKYQREFIWNYNNLELEIKEVAPKLKERSKVIYTFDNCIAELCYANEFKCNITKESYRDHNGLDASIYKTSIYAKEQDVNANIRVKINIIKHK